MAAPTESFDHASDDIHQSRSPHPLICMGTTAIYFRLRLGSGATAMEGGRIARNGDPRGPLLEYDTLGSDV